MPIHLHISEELINRAGILANVVAGFLLTPQLLGLDRLSRFSESLKSRSVKLAKLLSEVYPTPVKAFGIIVAVALAAYGIFLLRMIAGQLAQYTHLSYLLDTAITAYSVFLILFVIFMGRMLVKATVAPIDDITYQSLRPRRKLLVIVFLTVEALGKPMFFGILFPAALYWLSRLVLHIPRVFPLLGCLLLGVYLGYWRTVAKLTAFRALAILVLPRSVFCRSAPESAAGGSQSYSDQFVEALKIGAAGTLVALMTFTVLPFIILYWQTVSILQTGRFDKNKPPFRKDGHLPSFGLVAAIVLGPILYFPVKWLSNIFDHTAKQLESRDALLGAVTFIGILLFLIGNTLQFWASFHPNYRT